MPASRERDLLLLLFKRFCDNVTDCSVLSDHLSVFSQQWVHVTELSAVVTEAAASVLCVYSLLSTQGTFNPGRICDLVTPDSKVHGTKMGPTWGRHDPGVPHVGPMNLAIRDSL